MCIYKWQIKIHVYISDWIECNFDKAYLFLHVLGDLIGPTKLKRWDTLLPNRYHFYHSHLQYIGYFGESSEKHLYWIICIKFLQNVVASDHRRPFMSLLGCNEVYVIFQQIINCFLFLQSFLIFFFKEGGGGCCHGHMCNTFDIFCRVLPKAKKRYSCYM